MVSLTVILRTCAEAGEQTAARAKPIRNRDIAATIFLCDSDKSFGFFALPHAVGIVSQ